MPLKNTEPSNFSPCYRSSLALSIFRWSVVACLVETRNSGQCAKRWNDTLNPDIDRSAWSSEEDKKLLDAVSTHGTSWTTIVKSYFSGRTALAAKNRYSHLSRSSNSRRASSPSISTSSSCEAFEVPSPASTETSTDAAINSAESNSQLDVSGSESLDDMDFLFTDPALDSPSPSSSSSCLHTPIDIGISAEEAAESDSQMLERFLTDLAANSGQDPASDDKMAEFPFPDNFLSATNPGPMVQELLDTSMTTFTPDACYPLATMTNLDSPITLNAENIPSLWSDLKDCDLLSSVAPEQSSGRTSPSVSTSDYPSFHGLNIPEGAFKPDQQIAVAVAICRADNLRPTVQILIQSLAGALAQPFTSNSQSPSSSKT